jgi:hypothetical protein
VREPTQAELHGEGCPLCAPVASIGRCKVCSYVGPGPRHLCLVMPVEDYCVEHRIDRISAGPEKEKHLS